jgi:hypothetical protein
MHTSIPPALARSDGGLADPGRFPLRRILVLWTAVALIFAATDTLGRLPRLAVPLLIWSPVVAAVVAWRSSPGLRAATALVGLRIPVLYHALRIRFGAAFVVLGARGALPEAFAWLAGPGDIVAGTLALPAAWQRGDSTGGGRAPACSPGMRSRCSTSSPCSCPRSASSCSPATTGRSRPFAGCPTLCCRC